MEKKVNEYGKDLGTGIKEGLKGLNTVASPKSKKTTFRLMLIPLLTFPLLLIYTIFPSDFVLEVMLIPVICSGLYQFYIGKFKKGIIYTFTLGLCYVGILIDLFKLKITGTLRDSNGFPIIY